MVSAALYLTLALMLAEGAKSWAARGRDRRVRRVARGADRVQPRVSGRALAERRAGRVELRHRLGAGGVRREPLAETGAPLTSISLTPLTTRNRNGS